MNSETLLARTTLRPSHTHTEPPADGPRPLTTADTNPAATADRDEAEEFVRLFHTEHPDQPTPLAARLHQVRTQIDQTGTYTHTEDELTFGAQVAWRNSSRCIGRLYWKSLRVLDRRQATTPEQIHQQLCEHLRQATNGGRIRPTISIFAPETPGRRAPRVWNDQLIRYAGYRQEGGGILGDPTYVAFTDTVRRLGWQAPVGPWDVLPLVIDTDDDKPQLFDVPRDLVLEVHLTHPDHPHFADLGLRWHAVPAISNMRLRIGGIDYPLAPFNGWYMGTEIGARNLVDTDRYNLLPAIAEHLGLDTSNEATLWRDRALVELNRAVLHSFNAADVKISDHHTESRHFLTHLEKEERQGRTVPADWSWIVPPVSGGITPVFHRYYEQADQRPNFYLDDDAKTRGRGGCPYGH
ncbi:nitric oxide synthase oxygenase [Streptomyces erythrochromogenes]|uniref:nitric oxide synthase oxygenase n=1 Tax=Streptomyces erythrochromogenes TaxID=285574 RepID=UPI00224EDF4B|nr:nitric oxide synthase oxygenase [Streptomyces erythrochromogenes]MCX5582928.1 nitric oxide synthase oxygenase [Streptomyces erythrochromogenes]